MTAPSALQMRSGENAEQQTAQLLTGQLPSPARLRWQPLRVGLVNLYLFDNEIFPFADGRLLLRGDNGAGKSRVLALTLPLLLDGRLHPSRVEPDRDVNRQVAWNLLMDEHPDRTGYSWIEFGRIDESGQQHYLTLGLGLRGVRSRGITDHWMFMTSQRVGDQLSLVTAEQRVLTRRQLLDSIAGQGQLYESATEYRRAVDEHLFRLSDRYEALLDLLLQLRQPQLAKKLDLAGLETALREAMPPISSTLLSDAADAFRSLDQERETLTGLQQSRDTVQEFLKPYRRHLRLGLRRAAWRLRTRHSRYEQGGKELREAEQNKQQADAEVRRIANERVALGQQHKGVQAALQELRSDPAMKLAERLNTARQSHADAAAALSAAEQAADRAVRELDEAEHEANLAEQEVDQRVARAIQYRDSAGQLAAPQPLLNSHTEQFANLPLETLKTRPLSPAPDPPVDVVQEFPLDELVLRLSDQVGHWQRTATHVHELNQNVSAADEAVRAVLRRLNDAQDRQQVAADAVVLAEQSFAEARDSLWQQLQDWLIQAVRLNLELPEPDDLQPAWQDWTADLAGPSPLVSVADLALRRLADTLTSQRNRLQHQLRELEQRGQILQQEQQRLHDGETIRPPVSVYRDPETRGGRAGAAFWELVEFVDTVPQDEQPNWEAALEASGVLDAWLNPDGTLVDVLAQDTVLTLSEPVIADPVRRLNQVLRPGSDCQRHGIAPALVTDFLQRIGVGIDGGRIWIDSTGRWQNGPLSGCLTKPAAQFIGHAAQAAYRQRRLKEIADELTWLQTHRQQLETELQAGESQQAAVDQHRQALPEERRLTALAAQRDAVQQELNRAEDLVREVLELEQRCRQQRAAAEAERDSVAAATGLQDWRDAPESLLRQLDAYLAALNNTVEACSVALAAIDRLFRCRRLVARKQTEQSEHTARLQSAQQLTETRRAALAALQATAGTEAQQITQQIAKLEARQQQLERDREQAEQDLRQADRQLARLETTLKELNQRIQHDDQRRREAADGLLELVQLNLLPAAAEELADVKEPPTSLTATVELARRIEKLAWKVPDSDNDEAWRRSQTQIYNALEPLKGRLTSFNMNAEPEFVGENLCYVQIRHQGRTVTPDLLVKRLDEDVREHERILSENERQILEKHLLGEVAGELHERMHQTRALVASMNSEVSSRPMRTGMQMRFRWEIDTEGPAGLSAACQVLSTAAATWSAADRRELGDFLQRQIASSRERDEAGSRQEQLAAALDYRHWHRLRIDRRSGPDADWRLLTKRTYGSGSGGEKAIALTLPQVAAAAAYYRTADPLAPRLILMDEVFAGISSNNRAACMELLTAFELDVVMTSEAEWGCYESVPALAICQLTRMPDLAAIDNTVFVWTGRERLRQDQ